MLSGPGVCDRQRRADELQEQKIAEPEPEQVDADSAYPLLGLQGDADEGGDDAHHGPTPIPTRMAKKRLSVLRAVK